MKVLCICYFILKMGLLANCRKMQRMSTYSTRKQHVIMERHMCMITTCVAQQGLFATTLEGP
jgi:hypothetical protein